MDEMDGGTMPERFDLLGIVAALVAHGVQYVMVGDVAAQVRGAPTEADHVDVCVPGDPDNLSRLALALDQLGARQRSSGSEDAHQASFESPMGRLDAVENTAEFLSLEANASSVNLGRGVVARVASFKDLARSERASGDLSDAARLAAFADASAGSEEPTPTRRVKAPRRIKPSPEAGSRVDRILEKLSSVDAYLTEVNTGKRAVGRKKD
jgi:hypothetical protein